MLAVDFHLFTGAQFETLRQANLKYLHDLTAIQHQLHPSVRTILDRFHSGQNTSWEAIQAIQRPSRLTPGGGATITKGLGIDQRTSCPNGGEDCDCHHCTRK